MTSYKRLKRQWTVPTPQHKSQPPTDPTTPTLGFKPRANDATLLDVTCCVRLHTLLHVVGCCCVLLCKVWNQSNVCTALPTLLGPRTLITHGLQRLMGCIDAPQVPTFLGVVASICKPLPTRTQQLPTLLAQQCWELLRPFALSLTLIKEGFRVIWYLVSFHIGQHTGRKQWTYLRHKAWRICSVQG